MNELQKEYFEKVEKEQAEAEAAEEARLKAVMEAERKTEAVKQEAEKKAKEEAERKAEAEAIEIINRVKAEMAANKEKEAAVAEEDQSEAKDQQVEPPEQKGSETEDGEKDETEKKEPAKVEPKEEETDIYEREPVGEASMPKKSPKFKKGGRKSTAGKVPQRPQPQEAAATEEAETAKAQPKESKEEVPDMKQKEAEKPKKEQKKPEAETAEEEAVEKATPESKAAADREAKLQEVADEYQDKYKRLLAEFENARAREAKEASRMYDVGAKAVLEKLLPVVDNFERAIQTIPEEDKDRAFEQGVDKIYKQMMTILGDIGVEPMNAEGTEFNPDLHNAVMHVEDESLGENVVAEEMQKGYMYKDSVLRYSMVKVAN